MSIPREVRASLAVAQEYRFCGELAVTALPRLCAQLGGNASVLRIDLAADARSGWPRLHGSVTSVVELGCQRCGSEYLKPLQIGIDLRFVDSEDEERALLPDFDPYWVQDDRLPLHELVEDEVLLALPMLPRCPTCENAVETASTPVPDAGAKRDNPFAVLAQALDAHRKNGHHRF
ncbi:YceD family protein [Fontimonas thermophila]|nr:YceD family protein [Fontimonas thermophila]